MTVFDGIYSTVVVRDILERECRRGQRQITDADLLRKIVLSLDRGLDREYEGIRSVQLIDWLVEDEDGRLL